MRLPDFDSSFLSVLERAFAKYDNHVCIRCEGEDYTYSQVDRESAKVANALLRDGFRSGMKGAVYSLNSAVGFIATIGIIRAGGVWIPINPRNSTLDNIAIMLQFECEAVFYQELFADPIAEVCGKSTEQLIVVSLESGGGEAALLLDWLGDANATAPVIEINPRELISIPLTGGTTGHPKGVMLSHSNFCALDYNTHAQLDERTCPVWLCAAPMTHVGGRLALTSMSSGATFVILDKVDIQKILQTIERERITDMFLPPTAIYTLLEQSNLSDFDLSSLKQLIYGSAPIAIDKLKQALEVLGPVMVGGFGQTECPMAISSLRQDDHFVEGKIAPDIRLASVGKATPISELAILDEQGQRLGAGEVGEIAVKGPMVSPGYYRNPEETTKIRLDGWHLTGDIGYLDADGFLYISDRKKDIIITGGFNVYSAEVEQALMKVPEVKLAIVIGVPSEKWGEEVKGLVQLEAGKDITAEQILADAKETLGGVKAPKSIEFVEGFPRTPIGKIDKKSIRAPYWEGQSKNI
jgi:acyl-CoA synthetase (AMP-forming)/AMP-acid ligase II